LDAAAESAAADAKRPLSRSDASAAPPVAEEAGAAAEGDSYTRRGSWKARATYRKVPRSFREDSRSSL